MSSRCQKNEEPAKEHLSEFENADQSIFPAPRSKTPFGNEAPETGPSHGLEERPGLERIFRKIVSLWKDVTVLAIPLSFRVIPICEKVDNREVLKRRGECVDINVIAGIGEGDAS